MDKHEISKLAAFVNDEDQFNAAFDNVIQGIESGRIRSDDFPLASAPLRAGGLKDNREFVARFLEQFADQPLTSDQKIALDETIMALPLGASLEHLYSALEHVESLSEFTAALHQAQAQSGAIGHHFADHEDSPLPQQ